MLPFSSYFRLRFAPAAWYRKTEVPNKAAGVKWLRRPVTYSVHQAALLSAPQDRAQRLVDCAINRLIQRRQLVIPVILERFVIGLGGSTG